MGERPRWLSSDFFVLNHRFQSSRSNGSGAAAPQLQAMPPSPLLVARQVLSIPGFWEKLPSDLPHRILSGMHVDIGTAVAHGLYDFLRVAAICPDNVRVGKGRVVDPFAVNLPTDGGWGRAR